MARFDELFDEVLDKVRSAADITGKKTTEMVELGKLKYKAKQVSWELERTYSKLGVIVYEAKKGSGDFGSVIDVAVEEIDALNLKLDELEEKIRNFKKDRPHARRDSASEETVVDFEDIKPDGEEAPPEE